MKSCHLIDYASAAALVNNAHLVPTLTWVLHVMEPNRTKRKWYATCSINWLKRKTGLSRRQIIRHLKTLTELGMIRKQPRFRLRQQQSNLYRLGRKLVGLLKSVANQARRHRRKAGDASENKTQPPAPTHAHTTVSHRVGIDAIARIRSVLERGG